jgi:hypothetical protein
MPKPSSLSPFPGAPNHSEAQNVTRSFNLFEAFSSTQSAVDKNHTCETHGKGAPRKDVRQNG